MFDNTSQPGRNARIGKPTVGDFGPNNQPPTPTDTQTPLSQNPNGGFVPPQTGGLLLGDLLGGTGSQGSTGGSGGLLGAGAALGGSAPQLMGGQMSQTGVPQLTNPQMSNPDDLLNILLNRSTATPAQPTSGPVPSPSWSKY